MKASINIDLFRENIQKDKLFFYYDETGYFGKLNLDWEVDKLVDKLKTQFTVGGIVSKSANDNFPFEKIFEVIPTDIKLKNMYEVDPTGGIDIHDLLNSKKLNKFLNELNNGDFLVHFYISDILSLSCAKIISYIFNIEDYQIAGFQSCLLKLLWDKAHKNIEDFAKFLQKLKLSEVGTSSVFDSTIDFIFSKSDPDDLNILLIRKLIAEKIIVPGQHSSDKSLIWTFFNSYINKIIKYPQSEHIFDFNDQIKDEFDNTSFKYNGTVWSKYRFTISESSQLIQASDVLVGLVRKVFEFLDEKSLAQITAEKKNFTKLTLVNLDLLWKILIKSYKFNNYLLTFATLNDNQIIREQKLISLLKK